jgi:hypothetical protein
MRLKIVYMRSQYQAAQGDKKFWVCMNSRILRCFGGSGIAATGWGAIAWESEDDWRE